MNYKVNIKRVETYNKVVEVNAKSKEEARQKVREMLSEGGFDDLFDSFDDVTEEVYTPTAKRGGLTEDEIEDLKNWCCGLEYGEDQDAGIGSIRIEFNIRDRDMKDIYKRITKTDVKTLLVYFITSVAEPCEEFDEDMHFDAKFKDGKLVLFSNYFRM